MGRQRQLREPNAEGQPLGQRTEFHFDAANNRTEVVNWVKGTWGSPPQPFTLDDRTRTVYDPLNRPVEVQDPNANPTTYVYDAAGRLTSSTDRGHDPLGQITDRYRGRRDYGYDRLGHLVRETWYRVYQGEVRFDSVRQFVYDATDNLLSSFLGGTPEQPAVTLRHDRRYDDLNRLRTDTPAFTNPFTYTYDARSKRIWVEEPFGGFNASQYDAAGRLTHRTFHGGPLSGQREVRQNYQTDPNPGGGRLDRVGTIGYLKPDWNPSIETVYAYDGLGRTRSIQHRQADGANLDRMDYCYNPRGLLEREQRLGYSYSYAMNFEYDRKGQVTTQVFNTGTGPQTLTFDYDSNGNPIQPRIPASGNRAWVGGLGRLLFYEKEGNVIEIQNPHAQGSFPFWRWVLRFDNANHLVFMEGGNQTGDGSTNWVPYVRVSYTHDAEGQLVERSQEVLRTYTLDDGAGGNRELTPGTSLTRFVHRDGHLVMELSGNNTPQEQYARGDTVDQLWGKYRSLSPLFEWYLTDRQNSVLAQWGESNPAGGDLRLRKAVRYQGGRADQRTGDGWTDRYEYTARERDLATGAQQHRARWYGPVTGRWFSEDPIGFAGGDTNLYRYVHNSWPNATDPSGLELTYSASMYTRPSKDPVGEFLVGVGETAWGMVQGVWHLSPLGMVTDTVRRRDAHYLIPGYHLYDSYQQTKAAYAARGANPTDARDLALISSIPVLNWAMTIEEIRTGTSLAADNWGADMTARLYGRRLGQVAADVALLYGGVKGLVSRSGPGAAAVRPVAAAGGGLSWARTAAGLALAPAPQQLLRGQGAGLGRAIQWGRPAWVPRIQQAAHAYGTWRQPLVRSVADWMRIQACFAAGTPLRTPDGSKLIDHFQTGDRILSRDETNPEGPLVVSVVAEVFVRLGRIMVLRVGGQVVRTTAEHPFWRKDAGWTPCGELHAGDLLCSPDGQWVAVEEVQDTGEYETVYNLRVSEFHTYFVGCQEWGFSVWAHNTYNDVPGTNGNVVKTKAQIQAEVEAMLVKIGHTPEQAAAVAQRYAGSVRNNGTTRVLPGNDLHANLGGYLERGGGPLQPAGDWVRPRPGGRGKTWQLPENGVWTGRPGHSDFIPDNPSQLGISLGEVIQFRHGRANFGPRATHEFAAARTLTGNRNTDKNSMLLGAANQFNELGLAHPTRGIGNWTAEAVKLWAKNQRLAFHHAGGDVVQLVPYDLHGVKRLGIPGVAHQEFTRRVTERPTYGSQILEGVH